MCARTGAPSLQVVAAIIQREGEFLICQRRAGGAFALKWEFPGGKVQTGETLHAALDRELSEELDVVAEIGNEVWRTRHTYAEMDRELELIFFTADIGAQAPKNLAFERFEWTPPGKLEHYDFLPADRELIRLLAAKHPSLPRC
jgi:8-oxo-dGTP diphosphatase